MGLSKICLRDSTEHAVRYQESGNEVEFAVLMRKQQRKPGMCFICYYFPNILNYMAFPSVALTCCTARLAFPLVLTLGNRHRASGIMIVSFFVPRPVPGSLSSLLHLHNRQRQPTPASMPGTLPNPTMPGSSAVLMPVSISGDLQVVLMGFFS